jgi:hypothetical protein
MKVGLFSITLIFLCIPSVTYGQLGNWWFLMMKNELSDKWITQNEIQVRNYNIRDNHQFLARNGIGYYLSENNNKVLLGHAFVQTRPMIGNKDVFSNEHRIYQQFTHHQKIERLSLTHRIRTEERFIEGDMHFRFRYYIMGRIGINNRELKPGTWYFSFMNESFLFAKKDYYDRNRTSLGMGYVISDQMRLQIDCLNQDLPETGIDTRQIVFSLHTNLRWNTEH